MKRYPEFFEMQAKAHHIPYRLTQAFSPLVQDYLGGGGSLSSFYAYPPKAEMMNEVIERRRKCDCDRNLLVGRLKKDYSGLHLSDKVASNIDSLLLENTFTVCTAHQPAIFTGHLYFIYKIIHAIKVADELNRQHPSLHFVPVYFMGSEDADLDELGKFHLNGVNYSWNTGQSGAIGRMRVDEELIRLIDVIGGQLGGMPFGPQLMELLHKSYRPGTTIQEATFALVNELFGDYGLLVLLPDNPAIKGAFAGEMRKELEEGASAKALNETLKIFPDIYKVRAAGREINLFYLEHERRERIEKAGRDIRLAESGELKKEKEWQEELSLHPERFSPNVILRPVLQEHILPNVVFIGGGSELAYWLELKGVFEAFNTHFPMILLRNSFLLVNSDSSAAMRSMGFEIKDMFKSQKDLSEQIVIKRTVVKIELTHEKERLADLYKEITGFAGRVDKTLAGHVGVLGTQALKRIEKLEKKMLRAEKRKYAEELSRLERLRNRLFPGGMLQERVENFLPYYAALGKAFIQSVYDNSGSFEQEFCMLEVS